MKRYLEVNCCDFPSKASVDEYITKLNANVSLLKTTVNNVKHHSLTITLHLQNYLLKHTAGYIAQKLVLKKHKIDYFRQSTYHAGMSSLL